MRQYFILKACINKQRRRRGKKKIKNVKKKISRSPEALQTKDGKGSVLEAPSVVIIAVAKYWD